MFTSSKRTPDAVAPDIIFYFFIYMKYEMFWSVYGSDNITDTTIWTESWVPL